MEKIEEYLNKLKQINKVNFKDDAENIFNSREKVERVLQILIEMRTNELITANKESVISTLKEIGFVDCSEWIKIRRSFSLEDDESTFEDNLINADLETGINIVANYISEPGWMENTMPDKQWDIIWLENSKLFEEKNKKTKWFEDLIKEENIVKEIAIPERNEMMYKTTSTSDKYRFWNVPEGVDYNKFIENIFGMSEKHYNYFGGMEFKDPYRNCGIIDGCLVDINEFYRYTKNGDSKKFLQKFKAVKEKIDSKFGITNNEFVDDDREIVVLRPLYGDIGEHHENVVNYLKEKNDDRHHYILTSSHMGIYDVDQLIQLSNGDIKKYIDEMHSSRTKLLLSEKISEQEKKVKRQESEISELDDQLTKLKQEQK